MENVNLLYGNIGEDCLYLLELVNLLKYVKIYVVINIIVLMDIEDCEFLFDNEVFFFVGIF